MYNIHPQNKVVHQKSYIIFELINLIGLLKFILRIHYLTNYNNKTTL